MPLTEEEVYNGAKRWLQQNGYTIIAGQPARGVDHLPVIEIKLPCGDKGSKDAFKPDLVAYKNNLFYIVECKPAYNEGDRQKILSVLNSTNRLNNFYDELAQYDLLHRVEYCGAKVGFGKSVKGILAFSGAPGPDIEIQKLIVIDWRGQAYME